MTERASKIRMTADRTIRAIRFKTELELDDLEAAKEMAAAAIANSGDRDPYSQDAAAIECAMNGGKNLPETHPAVQSALIAIKMMRAELAPGGRIPHALADWARS